MRVAVAVSLLLLSAALHADASSPELAPADQNVAAYAGMARVVRADPIVARRVEKVPVKRCAWEYAPVRRRYHERYDTPHARRIQRCRTTQETRVRETVTGYDVTLKYNGETFTRRADEHPGSRMPVHVEVVLLDE